MTQANDICLPTPLSIQVFGRPEEWEWVEPSDANTETQQTAAVASQPQAERLSA